MSSDASGSAILDDLKARGLLQDSTDEAALRARLDAGPITLYCGFDPTADSLHIGNLVPLLLLRRFQEFGHRAIGLAGGATGMIGDPSGRSDERNLLDGPTLDHNLAAIKTQIQRVLGTEAPLVDNRDWMADVTALAFLRDVGKLVTINTMLAKESIRSRLDGENGLSFTEFSYMLLQANDFAALHEREGVELQVGGSDQWGNITAGIDMIRRKAGASAHGLTVPLVTRSDGAKFGKTAQGAVWLDGAKTLPYEFHQYWLRTDDRDVERFLLQMTLMDIADVATVMAEHVMAPAERRAQTRLADEVTALIHGEEEVARAKLAAQALFAAETPDVEALAALQGIVPESAVGVDVVAGDEPVVDLLVATGVASSKGDARRTVQQGGVRLNGVKVETTDSAVVAVGGRFVLIQKGKKQRHLAVFDS